MIKYISINSILNYIPQSIQEEVSATQLKSWGYQLFKMSNLNWKYEILAEIIEVKNHTAKLPDEALGLHFVGYAVSEEAIDSIITLKQTNLLDDTDRRLIIAQQQLLENDIYQYFRPIRYIGSNKSFHHLSICDECTIGFSVDKKLNCITLDLKEGFLLILYKTLVKDNGNILIPDDPTLLQSLAYYAQAQYWLDKAARGDRNAANMHTQMLSYATELFRKAKSLELFRNYSPTAHESMIEDRFLHQKLPVISGMYRNNKR
jgi:hypothetical protein